MLKNIYEAQVIAGTIEADEQQRLVLEAFEHLSNALLKPQKKRFWSYPKPVMGLYIHGPVGVGKTFLMDLFFDNIPIEKKKRFHFHHFMQKIDADLRSLQGQKNPLHIIAASLSQSTRVLCFDEFLVHDVAHAMILGTLLEALLAHQMVLIATSNTEPDNLYLNGVHRERFLPAIDMIKSHCKLLYLQSNRDYRLGRGIAIETYLYPLDEKTKEQFAQQFEHFAPENKKNGALVIQNRTIPYIAADSMVVWFDFTVLCNIPRSQLDYLEISDQFDTVFLDSVPILTENDTVFAILLIHLVDVLYDRGIKLVIRAACALEDLYIKGEMLFEFKRTYSRLKEMQAGDYLKRHPRKVFK